MIELGYRAFGALLEPYNEPSFLYSDNPEQLPIIAFYIDNIFGGFESFEEQFEFLRYHFLPRIELSFLTPYRIGASQAIVQGA